jgi:hypothetical protein
MKRGTSRHDIPVYLIIHVVLIINDLYNFDPDLVPPIVSKCLGKPPLWLDPVKFYHPNMPRLARSLGSGYTSVRHAREVAEVYDSDLFAFLVDIISVDDVWMSKFKRLPKIQGSKLFEFH